MSKLSKILLVSGSVIATAALLAIGYKKLSDSMKMLDFEDEI